VRHMRIDPCEGPGDGNAAWAKPTSVRDRMSRPAVTVSGRASLAEALQLMTDHWIHYLPVMDDEGHLVGMVNEDDVLGTRQGARQRTDAVTAAGRVRWSWRAAEGRDGPHGRTGYRSVAGRGGRTSGRDPNAERCARGARSSVR
jgi:hypothetical protein